MKNRKMGDLSDSERGQTVGASLVGASVTKTVTLWGVSRATVYNAMSAHTNHGNTTSVKRNSGRKSTLAERDCSILRRIFQKNHWTTSAQVTAEVNIHVEDKTVRREIHKSNIHGRASIAKPLITENDVQTRKRWCHDLKTWTSDNWKLARHMVRRVVLHAVPYIHQDEFIFGDTQRCLTIRNAWFWQWNTREVLCGLGTSIMVFYCLIMSLHGLITAREYVDRSGNQVHPMIQTLLPKKM
jgi:transposase